MKTVAFYQPFMNERGTCVAMHNYAHYNQEILGNKSFFIYDSMDIRNEENGLALVRDKFDLCDMKLADFDRGVPAGITKENAAIRSGRLDEVLQENNADYIYIVKNGWNDGVVPTKAKLLVHAVGMVGPEHRHGHVWAYCSYFSTNALSKGTVPVVPYMVDLPDEDLDMREQLGIPKDAVVVGRSGGQDTFNQDFAKAVLPHVLEHRPEMYFVFLNTPRFMEHERVIFLDVIVDPVEKVKYMNSCDVMLHLRNEGETFGMSCAEFSTRNKPVMALFSSPERNHIEILGDKGVYYNTPNDLYNRLMNFKPEPSKDWNCYKDYTPEKIMKIFDEVYLT